MSTSRIAVLIALAVAVLPVSKAHAYLDPGTGSMLIQGLIAAAVAAGVAGRVYWHRLMVALGVRKDAAGHDEVPGSRSRDDEGAE